MATPPAPSAAISSTPLPLTNPNTTATPIPPPTQCPAAAVPATTFYRFPDLPSELRCMIWSLCVPGRRVFELNTLYVGFEGTLPAGSSSEERRALASPSAGKFPVIARVCREARDMVLPRRPDRSDKDGLPGALGPLGLPLREGLDIVHLNLGYPVTGPIPRTLRGIGRLEKRDWIRFESLARDAGAASFGGAMFFNPRSGSLDFGSIPLSPRQLRFFNPGARYYIVLTVIELHMSDHATARAGVFGILGEEPIQLIDPRDPAAVARFRDAWARHGPPAYEEPDLGCFFLRATDPATAPEYHAEINDWMRWFEDQWLDLKAEQLNLPAQTAGEVWPDRLVFMNTAGQSHYAGLSGPNRTGPNRAHPWAQEQLAAMPRFEPALMFRHCP